MSFRFFHGLDTISGAGYPYGEFPPPTPPLTALLDLEEGSEDTDTDIAEGAD